MADGNREDALESVSAGACRVLAPTLGTVIHGAPVATPEAIPWGRQAGIGAVVTVEVSHRGDRFLFTVGEDGSMNTKVIRYSGGVESTVNSLAPLRIALESMESAVEVVAEARRKLISSQAKRGKSPSPETLDTQLED